MTLEKDVSTSTVASSEAEDLRKELESLKTAYQKVLLEKNFYARAMGDLNFHNNAHDGVLYLNAKNDILYANPYFLDMMGISDRTELLERPFPDSMWSDKSEADRLFKDIQENGFVRDRELTLYDSDGSPVFAMCSGVASRDDQNNFVGSEIMLCNITSKRQIQAELIQKNQLLETILESTPDPILVIDEIYELDQANPAATEIFELNGSTDGQNLTDLFARAGLTAGQLREFESHLHLGKQSNFEIKIKHRHYVAKIAPKKTGASGWVCLMHDITEQKLIEEKLQYIAFHDSLTDLPNRALFMDRLKRLIDCGIQRADYKFAILFMDVDRLKDVNDSLGHMIGDQLLIAVARRLEQCLRLGDTVARFGGDEFAIFLDNVRGAEDAIRVAGRIHEKLSLPFELSGHQVYASASIGIAMGKAENADPDELLQKADQAMYRTKDLGGGGYQLFQEPNDSETGLG